MIGNGVLHLPIYLALERKPDNGGKNQNIADVASGIML
jgi:hypothetical protein